jgi:GPH family glycoside/pentoside/hexuronide:cation symporter
LRVPLSMKFGYSAGLFGISMVQTSVSVLLLYFYTDILHIPPASAGGIVFLGTFADAFSSVFAAWVANHHRSPLGRYRPLLIGVSVPLAIFFALMFTRPDIPAAQLWIYAATTHLCYRICYAFTLAPHSALIGRLSSDADERSTIGAWKAVANNLGLMAAAYLGISTVEKLGGTDPARGFMMFGAIFGAIAGISVLYSALATRERAGSDHDDTGRFFPGMALILRNSQMRLVLVSTLIFFAGYMLMNSGVVYFFKYILMRPQEAKFAVVAIGVGGIVMPPLWSAAIRSTSKARIWAAGCIVMAAAFLSIYIFGIAASVPILLAYFLIGAGKSAVIVNFYAMTADAVDYGHWKLGARAEAYSFGFLSLANKAGTAIGGGLLGLLLDWSGLVVNGQQTDQTLGRLWLVICVGPAALALASAAVVVFFSVTASKHREIVKTLQAREDVR